MQIIFSQQKKYKQERLSRKPVFGAGLTTRVMEQINQADVFKISNRLASKGIDSDFQGNKTIAWCCSKTVEIFEEINKKFEMNLALPEGIYVKDFEELNIPKDNLAAFCNLTRSKLIKNSNSDTPAKTLFFNSFQTKLNYYDSFLMPLSTISPEYKTYFLSNVT